MVARHSLRFVIACEEDFSRAEEAIGSTGGPITIDAGLDSGTLLEIEEFRCLAAAARVSGASVTFSSDDPLRRELARIVGLQVEAPEPAVSALRRALESNAPTRKIEEADIPRIMSPAPVREPVPTLTEALNDYTNHGSHESYASFSFVITPPVPRRSDQAAGEWLYDSGSFNVQPVPRRYRGSRRVGKIAAIAAVSAIALIMASALVLVALIAPQATVTLVPETSAINADITYGVAGTGVSYDVAIDPAPITTTLSYSATIPTTGTRSEPDGTASGAMLFTNPSTTELTAPSGTVVTGPDGTSFSTTEDVVVPAADPFGSLTMGSASVGIVASVAGPAGNAEAGILNGQLDSGLFYSNRDAVGGGTLKEIPIVAEADMETLRSQAAQDFAERAQEQIQNEIPADYRALAGSGETDEPGFAFSHEIGEDATELQIESTMRVSALAYDPNALHEMAREELSKRLSASLPPDTVLLADTMKVDEPLEIDNVSGNPEYRVTASARARVVIEPGMLAELKHDLVGASEANAVRRVSEIEGVSRFKLDYGPEWFPLNWPPRLDSRIAIDIDDRPATQADTGETRP